MVPQKRFSSVEQARAYVELLPLNQLIEGYATLLYESQFSKIEPIKISEAQLKSLFKIVGYTSNGEVETRGRKRKQD